MDELSPPRQAAERGLFDAPRGYAAAPGSPLWRRSDPQPYSPAQPNGFPSRNVALKRALDAAFAVVGLSADYAAGDRRPLPPASFDEQMTRVLVSTRIVSLVRQTLPITTADRVLIHRLVDDACAKCEAAWRVAVAEEALAAEGDSHGR